MKGSETFKDLIENAVDSNEKIAGMVNDIKQANDELELQAKNIAKNAEGIGQVQTNVNELSSTVGEVSSSITQLEQTVASEDAALGQRIDNISVSMDGMTGGVKISAIAIIQANLAQVATRKTLSASVAGNSAQLDRIDEVIVTEKEATARIAESANECQRQYGIHQQPEPDGFELSAGHGHADKRHNGDHQWTYSLYNHERPSHCERKRPTQRDVQHQSWGNE
jgi:uncharacterized phage infection (PIP) family protein YhgE